MPEVLAEQHGAPSETALEGTDPVAACEIAELVEEAVGRKIDLAVHVPELAAVEEHGGVVEAKLRGLLHRAGHEGDGLATELAQAAQRRGTRRERHRRDHVLQEVAGQTQLREQQQIDPATLGLAELALVFGEVGLDVAEPAIDLGDADGEGRGHQTRIVP